MRGAFPGFEDPVSLASLGRLARRPDVESRLVLVRGGSRPWQVVPGPIPPGRMARLPRSHWTLLVQGVEAHVPAVGRLLEAFAFLPRWRLDDVMVSFAARGGSVGPHADAYDVFLIQGQGRRRWRLARGGARRLRRGVDLQLFSRFRPEQEHVLERGDMLYLPPGVAHHGVALEDCLTYSVGFRAPSQAELLAAALQQLVERAPRQCLYADPGLPLQRDPGRISGWALGRLARHVEGALRGLDLDAALGELLTRPKAEPPPRSCSRARLRRQLGRGLGLDAVAGSRLAFARSGRRTRLFANGRSHELPPGLAFAGPLLTRSAWIPGALLAPHAGEPGFLELLLALVRDGALSLAPGRRRSGAP